MSLSVRWVDVRAQIQKYCCKRFVSYLSAVADMQITAREDQLSPGLLDFRFNFDVTFPRQLLGTFARVLLCSCARALLGGRAGPKRPPSRCPDTHTLGCCCALSSCALCSVLSLDSSTYAYLH